jgi:hypothetical protein
LQFEPKGAGVVALQFEPKSPGVALCPWAKVGAGSAVQFEPKLPGEALGAADLPRLQFEPKRLEAGPVGSAVLQIEPK